MSSKTLTCDGKSPVDEHCFAQEFRAPGFFLDMADRGFPKLGIPFRGPQNKDYSILGSILGSPYLGKLPDREFKTRCRPKAQVDSQSLGLGFRALAIRISLACQQAVSTNT